ncbi:MAG: hypothetical protein IT336_15140 [Thermomicrobiales bacterium]|nr:hypothetical protein [Thermomicrobiales bacterium]
MSSYDASKQCDRESLGAPSERLIVDKTAQQNQSRGGSDRAPTPFAWQHGRQLILLDDDPEGWVMAELHFDSDLCRYVEVRRAVYPLTREAIGAVISRALASGDHAAVDTALSLHEWLSTYYGISIINDMIAPPDASSLEFTV